MGQLRAILIGLVVISGAVTGMLTFAGSMFQTYDTGAANDQKFNTIKQLGLAANQTAQQRVGQARDAVKKSGGEIAENIFIIGPIFTTIIQVFEAVNVVDDIAGLAVQATPLPTWTQQMVTSILWIIVVFTIASAYRGYEV